MEARVHGITLSSHLLPMHFANNSFSQDIRACDRSSAFQPEIVGDISRDVVHLAQMSQRTGQDHDDAILKWYGTREKRGDLKGKEMHSNVFRPIYLRRLQAC